MKVIFLFCFLVNFLFSQAQVSIVGQYSAILPRNKTIEEHENYCIEQARLSALGNNFGYRISEVTINQVNELNNNHTENFQSISQSQVQGEWISDSGLPRINWHCEENNLILTVEVNGVAREFIGGGRLSWSLNTCPYPDCKNPSSIFKNNSNLFLQLKTSESGFINVYYWDHQSRMMYRIFPSFQYNDIKGVKIKANKDYLLFSNPSIFAEHPTMMEFQLTINDENEQSQTDEIVVIFSEKELQKPLLNLENGIYVISEEEFVKWKSEVYSKSFLVDFRSIPVTVVR